MKEQILQYNTQIRFISYILIWIIYITFMGVYSPLGIDWLEWHSTRIYNFSEYLNQNGYFSAFGFSIMSSCTDCSLNSDDNQIYTNLTLFGKVFYILINEFFGKESLIVYGHYVDKIIIFLSGILFSEIFIKLSKKKVSNLYLFSKSILFFILFIVNPWTYKMIIASWVHIYFPFFFFLGILMLIYKKQNLGLLFFFIAGLFDFQSSAGVTFLYCLLLLIFILKKREDFISSFFPGVLNKRIQSYRIIISLVSPVIIFFFLKYLAGNEFDLTQGTPILTRIGISGDDIHNGGLLGSLQFLAGNRITQCLTNFDLKSNLINFDKSIFVYNCILSLTSMLLISLVSLLGLFVVFKDNNKFFNYIILPLIFLVLSYTFILQQSSSVHLMGYSYLFSFLFASGVVSFIFKILEKYNFSTISVVLSVPSVIGIMLLCIRVSMLTGVNG